MGPPAAPGENMGVLFPNVCMLSFFLSSFLFLHLPSDCGELILLLIEF